jgi:peptide/nickel transport system ATP-binding protein
MSAEIILEVQDLAVSFGVVKAVDGVTFSLKKGEVLGLVGESGSGKTVTGFSLLGLLPKERGKITFNGQDVSDFSQNQWRTLRGCEIAMIMQDPFATLNPVLTIKTQMLEACQGENKVSRCIEALERVGISEAKTRITYYPHQFSGGMRQRVAIAIALLNSPKLIIADEPTTALDVTIQAQILNEMQRLVRETQTSLIWITHDLSVVSGLAKRCLKAHATLTRKACLNLCL